MTIKRLEHWDTTHLHQFLLERRKTPFKWGGHDCCLFAADAIQAITGVDIASDFRGRYSDQASALDAIKSVTGGTTVEDAAVYCATKAGLPELPHPNFAHRGDLVLLNDAGQLIAGVIGLNSKPLSVGDKRHEIAAAFFGQASMARRTSRCVIDPIRESNWQRKER